MISVPFRKNEIIRLVVEIAFTAFFGIFCNVDLPEMLKVHNTYVLLSRRSQNANECLNKGHNDHKIDNPSQCSPVRHTVHFSAQWTNLLQQLIFLKVQRRRRLPRHSELLLFLRLLQASLDFPRLPIVVPWMSVDSSYVLQWRNNTTKSSQSQYPNLT